MLLLYSLFYLFVLVATSQRTCISRLTAFPDTIIETEISQRNGAIHLLNMQYLSIHECRQLCCENRRCTTAIYQAKSKRSCFLFDCGKPSVCVFTSQADYVAIVDKDDSFFQHLNETNFVSTVGEHCDHEHFCSHFGNMHCEKYQCQCNDGFIEKYRKCVPSICPDTHLTFQCDDTTKHPSCIPARHRCNGVAECGDESDELHCHIPFVEGTSKNENSAGLDESHHSMSVAKGGGNVARAPSLSPVHQSEDVIMKEYSRYQTKMAVIALILSLLVVSALLVYVVILYRSSKTGYRYGPLSGKGRQTNQDLRHLLNGMHL